ncbi:MAG: sugar ABC transporter substrate-binding protein [Clostridiales bacterium]|nr:sugar ABC transporter substrate-binding protein [Clostridiales bacterium]HBM79879.1 sugar ABC transporter substrate-binding protein [Clostridiaceae bacterium]
MKKITKFMSLALVSALIVTSLAGCGKNSANNGGTGTKNVTLTYLDWESTDMNKLMTEAIKTFESQNPGVTVKQIPTPIGDYGQKLNAMISSKTAPDIFQCGQDMALQMSAKGTTYDFTKEVSSDSAFTQGFYPGVYNLWKQNGKVIGLPGLLNVYGVFYNKDLLAKANVQEPKDGWTWNDLFELADKLKSDAGGVHTYGLYNLAMDPFNIATMSVGNGGQPFCDNLQNPTKVMADDKFKEVVTTLQNYIKKGAITPPSYKEDNINSAFAQGKVPMLWYGQWEADDLIRNAKNLKWGFAPAPAGTVQKSVMFDSVGWASPKSIKNPELVWKLLKFMDSTMYEKILPQTPVAPPAYEPSAQPYYEKVKSVGHQELADSIDSMLKTSNKQPIRFLTTWAGDANKFTGTDWNDILESKKDISTIDTVVKNINNVINSNK